MCCFKSFKFSILFGLIFFPSWVFSIPPTAEGYVIGLKEGHAPFTVQLSAIELDGISSYIWMASNGLNALNSMTEMTFETPGSYDISLEVVDTGGLRSSSPVATVTVKAAPPDVPPVGSEIPLEAFFDIVILGKEGEKEDGSSFTIPKITFEGDENVFVNKPLDEPLLKIGLVSRSTGQNIIDYDWNVSCYGDISGSDPTISIDVTEHCSITLTVTDNGSNTSKKTRGIAIGEVCALIYNLPEQIIAGEEKQEITINACEPEELTALPLYYELDVQPFNPGSECTDIAPNFGQGLHVFEKPSTTMPVTFEIPGQGLFCSYQVTLGVTDGNELQLTSESRVIKVLGPNVEPIKIVSFLFYKGAEKQTEPYWYHTEELSVYLILNFFKEKKPLINCGYTASLFYSLTVPEYPDIISELLLDILEPSQIKKKLFFREGQPPTFFEESPFRALVSAGMNQISIPIIPAAKMDLIPQSANTLKLGKYTFQATLVQEGTKPSDGEFCYDPNDASLITDRKTIRLEKYPD